MRGMSPPLVTPAPPRVAGRLPWVGAGLSFLANPTEFLRRTRARVGDSFLLEAFGFRLFFVFSPEGLRSLYALPEKDASFSEATRTPDRLQAAPRAARRRHDDVPPSVRPRSARELPGGDRSRRRGAAGVARRPGRAGDLLPHERAGAPRRLSLLGRSRGRVGSPSSAPDRALREARPRRGLRPSGAHLRDARDAPVGRAPRAGAGAGDPDRHLARARAARRARGRHAGGAARAVSRPPRGFALRTRGARRDHPAPGLAVESICGDFLDAREPAPASGAAVRRAGRPGPARSLRARIDPARAALAHAAQGDAALPRERRRDRVAAAAGRLRRDPPLGGEPGLPRPGALRSRALRARPAVGSARASDARVGQHLRAWQPRVPGPALRAGRDRDHGLRAPGALRAARRASSAPSRSRGRWARWRAPPGPVRSPIAAGSE